MRRGWIDALVIAGIRTRDPQLVRLAIRLWWMDTTANGLGDGHDTIAVQSIPASLPPVETLQAGDLAISAGGVHILAYLGQDQWIDADPSAGKVRILPTGENPWLADPVKVVRWKWLAATARSN